MNNSALSNEDIATMAFEAIELGSFANGLWAMRISGWVDEVSREFDAKVHNVIINAAISSEYEDDIPF